jgi:hypothetical protein
MHRTPGTWAPALLCCRVQVFRQHAVFNMQLGDFVLEEKSLRRLLAQLQLLWGGAGMGLGDLSLLVSGALVSAAMWQRAVGHTHTQKVLLAWRGLLQAGSGALAAAASGIPYPHHSPGRVLTYHAVCSICRRVLAPWPLLCG